MMEKPWWQRALYQAWPTITRVINDILFLIEKVIRGLINGIKRQIF